MTSPSFIKTKMTVHIARANGMNRKKNILLKFDVSMINVIIDSQIATEMSTIISNANMKLSFG